MKLVVQKFGGSSVANVDKILNISNIITNTYDQENNVVVVVSAQGNTTNELIKKMIPINSNPSKREMDVLLSVGEQISIALLASAIKKLGYPVISLTGWQIGIHTDSLHQNARIKYIDTKRIYEALNNRTIVVIAGFQGIDDNNDITTLGRGGSDTSAVALAATLEADVCQVFTDVDGVYTSDPRLVNSATKIDEITFDEMLEMASLGAQILHNRSVELAKNYNIEIDVISSFSKKMGTRVKEVVDVEKNPVRGITRDNKISVIAVTDKDNCLDKYNLFSKLERHDIVISGISLDEINNNKEFSFIIPQDKKEETINMLNQETKEYIVLNNISKISLVGSGLMSNTKVISKLFKILSKTNIKPYLILTGEITLSIIVDESMSKELMNLLHDEYNLPCI